MLEDDRDLVTFLKRVAKGRGERNDATKTHTCIARRNEERHQSNAGQSRKKNW